MKILVVGPAWVGDMMMAQSLFICLRQQDPAVRIEVLAPAWCRDLLSRMPEVDVALPLPIDHGELALGKRHVLARELRARAYDQAIVLPNSFKSALIPRFAGIPLRTGWRGEARGWLLNDCRRLDKAAYPLMVQRFAALAFAPGQPLPPALPRPCLQVDPAATVELIARLGLDPDKAVLALCPGAEFGPAKQWPEQHYAVIADHYLRLGWQVWMLGSARDHEVAERIRLATTKTLQSDCHNLCGQTTLGAAADLLAAATAVVSNDSGLMHVAAALGRPLVVVYGSTSAAFTPPLADRVRTLSLQLPCSPCFKRQCPLGHLDCLKRLYPAQVAGALAEVMTVDGNRPSASSQ